MAERRESDQSLMPENFGETLPPAVFNQLLAYLLTTGTLLLTVGRLADMVGKKRIYTVGFVGFSPGFAYLLGLPPALERPRRASPRPWVPAGSVAIAGPFSGVYPQATPGGWHLLGRLGEREAPLFDPFHDPPARLAPGDRVRFVPR